MIVIAFKNKISGKRSYLTTIDTGPCTSIIDSAMKFDNMQDATTYYMLRYPRLKAMSNIDKWKKNFGINIDKPYFTEMEKED